MQDELQEELAQELVTYNIDPMAEGLTDEEYSQAMADLGRRREAMLAGKSPEEQRRIHAMRNNMLWHLHTVSPCAHSFCSCMPVSAWHAEPCKALYDSHGAFWHRVAACNDRLCPSK